MTQHPYPPTFLPCYPGLNPSENSYMNERRSTTFYIKNEQKMENLGDITSIMGYFPSNG